ncbi:MAG: hypothetical protein E6J37_10725 [Chloroflexi bacterium]|nr:MAG: hypothetical protein E6J37_10725 [Chloroflexota bacterium]
MTEIKNVLVVGAGTMGSQIALQTALSGRYAVTLVDSAAGQRPERQAAGSLRRERTRDAAGGRRSPRPHHRRRQPGRRRGCG